MLIARLLHPRQSLLNALLSEGHVIEYVALDYLQQDARSKWQVSESKLRNAEWSYCNCEMEVIPYLRSKHFFKGSGDRVHI